MPCTRDDACDAVTHWGLAFVGVCLFALLLMLVHIATSGNVFGQVWPTRAATIAVVLVLGIRKLLSRPSTGWKWSPSADGWAAIGLVIVAWLVWCSPTMRSMPIDIGGDVTLHAGWSSQLLNGETTPSAAITGEIPNFYPWLTHSVTAMLARTLPEGRAYHAMAPLQLLQVAGIALSLFALGRALTQRVTTGLAASLFGALTGGLGFLALRKVDVVLDPRAEDALRYFGDLFHRRSYNAAFGQMTPAFPRDIALTLAVGFLLLAVVGLKKQSRPLLVASGVTLGMTGLTGAESFYVGMGAAVLVCLSPNQISRSRRAAVDSRSSTHCGCPVVRSSNSYTFPLQLSKYHRGNTSRSSTNGNTDVVRGYDTICAVGCSPLGTTVVVESGSTRCARVVRRLVRSRDRFVAIARHPRRCF